MDREAWWTNSPMGSQRVRHYWSGFPCPPPRDLPHPTLLQGRGQGVVGSDSNSATYLLDDLGWVACPLWAPELSISMEVGHIYCVLRYFFPCPSLRTLLSLCRRAIVSELAGGCSPHLSLPCFLASSLLRFQADPAQDSPWPAALPVAAPDLSCTWPHTGFRTPVPM